MIVDAAWYVEGKRILETDSIADLAAERGKDGFGWLGLRMPTDDELNEAAKAFEIPDLAIADARHKHDRPKVERHDDCLLTVVPTARYVDSREEVEFGELFFYAGRDYIVTVRYGQAAPLKGVRHELEHRPERAATRTGCSAAGSTAACRRVLRARGRRARERRPRGRARRVQRVRNQPTKRIYFLIREVLDFLIALEPLSAAMKRLTGPECGRVGPSRDRPAVPRRRRGALRDRRARPDGPRTAEQRPRREHHPGGDAPERGHQTDLGVGGDRRRSRRSSPACSG